MLLDGAAPQFITPIEDQVFTTNGALTIAIDALDPDGDNLTITAVSDNANLEAFVPTGNRFARLNFVDTATGDPVGAILVELFEQRGSIAAERFITHATNEVLPDGTLDPQGTPFYTDVLVHRVVPGFVIQTGDAINGNGTGGSPLGSFEDVFDPHLAFEGPGVLAMANSGPDTNGSQFFITAAPTPNLTPNHLLNGHMIFGQMIGSQDVFDAVINSGNSNTTMASVDILENDQIQGGTVTFRSVDGKAADANVTIRLDDGNGNVTEQTITIKALHIDDPGPIYLQPGDTHRFTLDVNGGDGLTLGMTIDQVDATATLDPDTGQVQIDIPDDFIGTFQMEFIAALPDSLSSTTQSITVFSQSPGTIGGLAHVATNPGALGSSDVAFAFATAQKDNLLYVANGKRGLEIWDIADPRKPMQIGALGTSGEVRDVIVVDNVAYLADISFFDGGFLTPGGVVVVDISNPTNPMLLDSFDTAGLPLDLFAVDGTLFVAADDAGLIALDVSNPANISLLGTITDLGSGEFITDARAVIVHGNHAFVTDQTGSDGAASFAVYDVSDPQAMILVTRQFTAADPWGLDLVDDHLYVAAQDIAAQAGSLQVYDVADPANPQILDTLAIDAAPWQVLVADDMAIVASRDGFVAVDVADPSDLSVDHVYQGPSIGGVPSLAGDVYALPFLADGITLASMDQIILGVGGDKLLTFTTANDTVATLSFKGSTAIVRFDGDDMEPIPGKKGPTIQGTNLQIQSITITGSSSATTLTFKAKGGSGLIEVGDIIVEGAMKSIAGKVVDLLGDLTLEGGITKLDLHDVNAEHLISIGPSDNVKTALKLKLNQAMDTVLTSLIPIKSITAEAWTGAQSAISAPELGKLNIKGDLNADITVAGPIGKVSIGGTLSGDINAESIKNLKVGGNWIGAQVALALAAGNALGKAVVGGAIKNVVLRTVSDIGKIIAQTLESSTIFAGVSDLVTGLPGSLADLTATGGAQIKAITLKETTGSALVDSLIAARTLGKLSFRLVATDNQGDPFGVVADTIKSLSRTGAHTLKKLDEPDDSDADDDFRITLV